MLGAAWANAIAYRDARERDVGVLVACLSDPYEWGRVSCASRSPGVVSFLVARHASAFGAAAAMSL